MAAAVYNKLTDSRDAVSAGTYTGASDEPEGQILANLYEGSPYFFEVMETNGMNVRQNKTVKLLPEMLSRADAVVSMAEEPFIPDFLKDNKKVILWEIENPTFVTKEIAEDTFNRVNKLVKGLIKSSAQDASRN
jgi:protein-tyrosine-phosphatase